MNTQHTTIRTGFGAVISGGLLLLAPLGADAANRLVPQMNKPTPNVVVVVNSPTWNPYPCPAADTIALCDLHRTTRHNTTTIRCTPVTTRAGGGAVILNPGHMTPNPR